MKDKWTIGPKFRDYFFLNLRMVRFHLLGAAVLSLAGPVQPLSWLILCAALLKLYSTVLYHQQACLYQSVPVSSFETALTKILIGAAGSFFPLLFMGSSWSFLHILQSMALAFLLCGIALFGVAVGNRARGNRDKRPNAGTAVLVIGGLFLILYGLFWMMEQITFRNALLQGILQLAGCTFGAGLMFWLNVRALERWYSI